MSEFIKRQEEEIERMKVELNECKERIEDHERDSELLKRLYDNGYIDLDGNPVGGDG